MSVVPGDPGWTAARIGVGGLGDSLRICRLWACLSSDLSPGRRPGVAHRVVLIIDQANSYRHVLGVKGARKLVSDRPTKFCLHCFCTGLVPCANSPQGTFNNNATAE